MADGQPAGGVIGRRSAPTSTPLRRGAAVVVTGGALTLAGVAATVPLQAALPTDTPAALVNAAAVLPVDAPASVEPTAPADVDASAPTSALMPVPADAGAAGAERFDTAKLVKAVQLAEGKTSTRSRAAAELTISAERPSDPDDATPTVPVKPRATASPDCDLDTSQLGAVKPHVRAAAKFIGCRFGEPTVLGVAGRGGSSDHPSGKALDFMVDKVTGNAIAACALRDQDALGVSYVIWRQRINFGSGWKPMEDRGGATANHMDHVHVSFASKAGGRPRAC